VTNQLRIRVANRSGTAHAYAVEVTGAEHLKLIAPLSPLPVQPGSTEMMPIFITLPGDAFDDGVRTVLVRITDGGKYTGEFPYRLAGPFSRADDERAAKRDHDAGDRAKDQR